MRSAPRLSIRDKLIALLTLPALLTALTYGALLFVAARAELENELGRRLVSIGQTLSADISRGIEAAQIARLDETKTRTLRRLRGRLEAIKADTGARRVFLFDPKMKSLVDTDPRVPFGAELLTLEADRTEIARTLERGEPTTSVLFSAADGTRYKTAYVPVYVDPENEESPIAAIGIEASAHFFALLNDFARALFALGAISVLAMAGVGVFFARRLTRPVRALAEAARRLERGELDEAILEGEALERARRGDELSSLAASFEEMRRAVRGRDERLQMMLSGIAHEVRNPLGGMELFCGLLAEDLAGPDERDAERLQKVRRIERELAYLDRVVTSFLDYARQRAIEPTRLAAGALLDEIAELVAPQATQAGCAIEVDVEPRDLELSGDRERLRGALLNAARNAYQASPRGGTICLKARASDDDSARILEVTDQGVGIEPDQIERMLTPFYTTKEKGSGLGLALIAKVAEQHEAELSIQSAPGRGTTVRLTLPFDPSRPSLATRGNAIPQGWLG